MNPEVVYKNLNRKKHAWATEEEVRLGWISELEKGLGIIFHAERGRNDASYNQIIIEFKNKGLFNGSLTSPAFKEAINDRLNKYIKKKSQTENIPIEEYIGIAIDGDHIIFAHFRKDKIKHGPLLKFDRSSTKMVMLACEQSKHRAVTSENIIDDFGHMSIAGRAMMQAISDILVVKLKTKRSNKIKMLYQEWKTLFGQVAGLSKLQKISIENSIGFNIEIEENERISAILFVIHTYNSFLIKLFAAEIIAEHELTSFKNFAQEASTLSDDGLIDFIDEQLENSSLFEAAGINGFVEEVIFSWYIDAYRSSTKKKPIVSSIKDILY